MNISVAPVHSVSCPRSPTYHVWMWILSIPTNLNKITGNTSWKNLKISITNGGHVKEQIQQTLLPYKGMTLVTTTYRLIINITLTGCPKHQWMFVAPVVVFFTEKSQSQNHTQFSQ